MVMRVVPITAEDTIYFRVQSGGGESHPMSIHYDHHLTIISTGNCWKIRRLIRRSLSVHGHCIDGMLIFTYLNMGYGFNLSWHNKAFIDK